MFISRVLLVLLISGVLFGCSSAPEKITTKEGITRAAQSSYQHEHMRPTATAKERKGQTKEVEENVSLLDPVPGKPDWFETKESCIAGVQTEGFNFYTPTFEGGKGRNPTDGTTRVSKPLEAITCVLMETVHGYKWVAQPKGTLVRYEKFVDGTEKMYARDSCGNPIKEDAVVPFLKKKKQVACTECCPKCGQQEVAPKAEVQEWAEVTTYEAEREYIYAQPNRNLEWGVGGAIAVGVIGVAACFVSGLCDFGGNGHDIDGPNTHPPTIDDINTHPSIDVNTHDSGG